MFADSSRRALVVRGVLYPLVSAVVVTLLGEPWWFGAAIGLLLSLVWVAPELYSRRRSQDEGAT